MPFGRDAIVLRDDGLPADPKTDLEWLDWVAAGDTRNWCRNDLIVDWLNEYGRAAGFVHDREIAGYDETFDLGRFLMQQGHRFERALIADLGTRWEVVRIAKRPDEARSLGAATATWEAMRAGIPVIAGAVLRDPQLRTFGVVDLLVRNDVLAELEPSGDRESVELDRGGAVLVGEMRCAWFATETNTMTMFGFPGSFQQIAC